jgi:hypothetical protein
MTYQQTANGGAGGAWAGSAAPDIPTVDDGSVGASLLVSASGDAAAAGSTSPAADTDGFGDSGVLSTWSVHN